MPQSSKVTSKMPQRLDHLRVSHIIEANEMVDWIMKLPPYNSCINPSGNAKKKLVSISDASHGGMNQIHSRTGGLCGLLINNSGCHECRFHPISWTSDEQKRVTYSSFGPEIPAVDDTDDRG